MHGEKIKIINLLKRVARSGWVGNDLAPIIQEAEWAMGLVQMSPENLVSTRV
jgi:hypothetical protein